MPKKKRREKWLLVVIVVSVWLSKILMLTNLGMGHCRRFPEKSGVDFTADFSK